VSTPPPCQCHGIATRPVTLAWPRKVASFTSPRKGQRIWATLSQRNLSDMVKIQRWEKRGEKWGYWEYPMVAVKRRHMEPIGKRIWDHANIAKDNDLKKTRKPKFTDPLKQVLLSFRRAVDGKKRKIPPPLISPKHPQSRRNLPFWFILRSQYYCTTSFAALQVTSTPEIQPEFPHNHRKRIDA